MACLVAVGSPIMSLPAGLVDDTPGRSCVLGAIQRVIDSMLAVRSALFKDLVFLAGRDLMCEASSNAVTSHPSAVATYDVKSPSTKCTVMRSFQVRSLQLGSRAA